MLLIFLKKKIRTKNDAYLIAITFLRVSQSDEEDMLFGETMLVLPLTFLSFTQQ